MSLCNLINKNPEAFTIGVLVTFAVSLIGVIFMLDSIACSTRWDGIHPTQYKVMGGCRVNVNGQWLPERVLRVVE